MQVQVTELIFTARQACVVPNGALVKIDVTGATIPLTPEQIKNILFTASMENLKEILEYTYETIALRSEQ